MIGLAALLPKGGVGSLDHWIVGLLDRWIVGLLDHWIVGSLDHWISCAAAYRRCWIIGLAAQLPKGGVG